MEVSNKGLPATGPVDAEAYVLSPKRFLVLLAFCVFSFVQSLEWFTYGGFPDATLGFYKVSPIWINLYLAIGPVAFIVATPFFIWLLDKKGLRVSTLVGSGMLLVCAGLKCASLLLPGVRGWPLALVGQVFSSLAGPAAMATPPKLSSIWFGPNERSVSTSVAVVCNSTGTAAGFLLGLMCTAPDGSCVPLQLWIQLGLAGAQALLVALFMFDKPPSPSSHATDRDVAEISLLRSTGKLLTSNWAFLFLVLAAGCSQGVFSTWAGLLVEILTDPNDPSTQTAANWVGFAANIFGVVGGLVMGGVASVYRLRYKAFIVSLFFASGVAFVVFNLTVARIIPYNFWLVAVMAAMGSFLCNASNPLFYELAVELAYPAPEGLVGAIVALLVNVFGIPVYPLQGVASGSTIVNWVNVGNSVFFGVFMLFMRETYRRAAQETATASATEITKLLDGGGTSVNQ